jgi:hypothetical protein
MLFLTWPCNSTDISYMKQWFTEKPIWTWSWKWFMGHLTVTNQNIRSCNMKQKHSHHPAYPHNQYWHGTPLIKEIILEYDIYSVVILETSVTCSDAQSWKTAAAATAGVHSDRLVADSTNQESVVMKVKYYLFFALTIILAFVMTTIMMTTTITTTTFKIRSSDILYRGRVLA